jgi:hypothetical protein|tara:strand:+ start:1160 stop:1471 length:312 start_codon:yes stop_codon:yes gene_type:complete
MTSVIDKLTVNTDEERMQWIEILKAASDYHYDLSGEFEPEEGDEDKDDMASVAKIHRAWGTAIRDAVQLINLWELEEEELLIGTPTPKPPVDITPAEDTVDVN